MQITLYFGDFSVVNCDREWVSVIILIYIRILCGIVFLIFQ